MAGNTFGNILQLTSFGESHGPAIGGVIDGFPAGVPIDLEAIQHQLDRRKPGQSKLTTARKEEDQLVILSGIFEGKTIGSPIGFYVKNKDQRSADYAAIKDVYRPSHADYTYDRKYGERDYRGGGRSSARTTVANVVAGAFAQQLLKHWGIVVWSYVSGVGPVKMTKPYTDFTAEMVDQNPLRCPDAETAKQMEAEILKVQKAKDSVGGLITCVIQGVPAGIGEPVFDKLQADLAKAMLGINACKGFEYGLGFAASDERGSRINDSFTLKGGQSVPASNHSGGIQGGISNGADIYMRLAFKPVATIMQDQQTLDKHGNKVKIEGKGRHDVCVLPRAVPIVDAMAALVIADHYLMQRLSHL